MKIHFKKRQLQEMLVLFFVYVSPIIDNLLGGIMRSTDEDALLGKVYRFFFVAILLLILLFQSKRKDMIKILLISVWFILLPLIYSLMNSSTDGLIIDYIQISKLFYPIILYQVLSLLISKGRLLPQDIEYCIRYYIWFYPLSLVIPYILGLGYRSYAAYDAGYSGFYAAGNELSIVLVAVFIISFDLLISKKEYRMILAVGLNIFCILLTGSKTGMIMLIVGTIAIMLHTRDVLVRVKRVLGIICCCIPISYGVIILMKNQIDTTMKMIQFKYNQLDGEFISFLFSNRNKKIIPNFVSSISSAEHGILNFFIGKGYYRQAVIYKTNLKLASSGLVEMDLFDIFYQHGIVVTVGVSVFYLKKILERYPRENWGIHFAAMIMMIFGLLAGHTFQSTLPSTILIMLLIRMKYIVLNKEEVKVHDMQLLPMISGEDYV